MTQEPHDNSNPAPLSRVGDMLRQARILRGVELRVIADQLRIREHYLAALENGDDQALPGTSYAFGFVRSYAAYLGLDGEKILASYKAERRLTSPAPLPLGTPTPLNDRQLPGFSGMLAGLAMLVALVLLWNWWQHPAAPPATPAVPERLQQATQAPPMTLLPAVTAVATTAAAPLSTVNNAAAPANGMIAVTPIQPPGMGAPIQPPAPAPAAVPNAAATPQALASVQANAAAAPPVAAAGSGGVRLRLVGDSWLELRDLGGNVLESRVFRQGEEIAIPDPANTRLIVGNAAGVVVQLDGQDLPPLGAEGEVRRDISLAPESLRGQSAPR